jgi:LmbE family N-acetylglucosaminyl deacetylase
VVGIGAHPDDIELGMAGTIAKHSSRGDEVHIVICTLGIGGKSGDPNIRELEAKTAASILGAKLHILDYPVVKLNKPSSEFERIVRKAIEEMGPDRLYTHSPFDYHQVHETVSQCVTQAASDTRQILFYEVIPSTNPCFIPNAYVDITQYIDLKLKSLAAHNTQGKKWYMQPNALTSLAYARYMLGKVGARHDGMAEAFAIKKFIVEGIEDGQKVAERAGMASKLTTSTA